MKYTITHVAEWILLAILAILCIYTAYKSYQIKEKVKYITIQDTIKLNDTIVDMEYDTCYLWKKDTVKLPVVINDTTTLIKIDSILVEVPKYKYYYDTILKDTAYSTRFSAVIEGFDVNLDSVYLNTIIAPQKAKKEPWYRNICPAVGVGYGISGFGIFAGVGYKLN
jgi:hypothetical protein